MHRTGPITDRGRPRLDSVTCRWPSSLALSRPTFPDSDQFRERRLPHPAVSQPCHWPGVAQQGLCRARARLGLSFFFQNVSFAYLYRCAKCSIPGYRQHTTVYGVVYGIQLTSFYNFISSVIRTSRPNGVFFLCVARRCGAEKLPNQESGPYKTRSLTDMEPQ